MELKCPASEMNWWEQTSAKYQRWNPLIPFLHSQDPFFHKANLAFKNNMAGLQFVNQFPKMNIKLQEQSANKKLFKILNVEKSSIAASEPRKVSYLQGATRQCQFCMYCWKHSRRPGPRPAGNLTDGGN